jgi:hypothetical protein
MDWSLVFLTPVVQQCTYARLNSMTAASGDPEQRRPAEADTGGLEPPPFEQTPAYGGYDVPTGVSADMPAAAPAPPVYPAYETPVYPAYEIPPAPAYGTPPDPAWATPYPPQSAPYPPPPAPYPPPPGYPPPAPYGPGYPPGPMGYPGYQGYPGYPGYPMPPQAGTNSLAITALVCSILGLVPLCGFLFSIAGIVAGAVSINQIKRTRERGNGLAIAGIIVGVITLLIWMVGLTYTWG